MWKEAERWKIASPCWDGSDAAAGEATAVARAIDEVHDGRAEVTFAQEVSVYRMRLASVADGAACGDECLGEHLAAVDAAGADVAVGPTVDIVLEWFELEEVHEVGDDGHGAGW